MSIHVLAGIKSDLPVAFFTLGEYRNTLGRVTSLQVVRWQGIDNGERGQTREDSEETETHCERVVDQKIRGVLGLLRLLRGNIYTFAQSGQLATTANEKLGAWT